MSNCVVVVCAVFCCAIVRCGVCWHDVLCDCGYMLFFLHAAVAVQVLIVMCGCACSQSIPNRPIAEQPLQGTVTV